MIFCASCRSEIRVTELRAAPSANFWGNVPSRWKEPSRPIGAISWCPVHGVAYVPV